MCGIAGFNFKDGGLLANMIATIRHRGPDDSGIYEDENFSLGHVRLSILDLTAHGHQPMRHEHLVIAYNGEVYNYREIREELAAAGYEFFSNTDTEVVLKAYHKWGIKAVDKFVGMFAIAIYDTKARELVLMRDRIGVKPLYYYFDGEVFIFASELRPIMESERELEISEEAFIEFFQFGYISSGRSIFENCHKLPAGHYLAFNAETKEVSLQEYWSIIPFFELPKFSQPEEELIDNLEALLVDAFKYRMVSDVPVGVFLSGGIDSALLASILRKHHGDINTFTIGFKEEGFNEAEYARELAEYLGTTHAEKILDISEAGEVLDELADIYDEPFGDCSGIPATMLSRVAKDAGMKVVLSGDGGDELSGGYNAYPHAYGIGSRLFSVPAVARKAASLLLSGPGVGRVLERIEIHSFPHKYRQLLEILTDNSWKDVYEKIIHSTKNYEMVELHGRFISVEDDGFRVGEREHPIQGMMLWDFRRYLVDDILVKMDRATMSASIEGRVPLLDHRVAEFMARVPFDLKYKEGTGKYLFRKVLERYIPRKMLDRPKIGFGIPIVDWFRKEWGTRLERYLRDPKDDGRLNYSYLREEYDRLNKGKTHIVNKLWFALVFEMWREKYM